MKLVNGAIYSVNAAALLLGAAGLFSRLLGIFRDRLLASKFGAGRELDLYYTAFQVPDFMVALFILGAGSAAILPIFQEYLSRDREEARRLISELTFFFIGGAILAALTAFVLTPFLIRLVAPGFSEEEQAITGLLTRIMLVSPIFFGLSGIFSSVVQSFQRFLAYAVAPLLYNIGIIVGIVVFVPILGIEGLAFGVILGSLLHLGIMFWTAKELGFAPNRVWGRLFGAGLKKVLRLSFPRVLALSFSQITGIVLIALGSTLAVGSIAVFQLAQNLYFLPVGIFGVSYSVAVFPRLSRSYLARDAESFFGEFFLGIRSVLFWILPSVTLFLVLRAHIVRVALGAGEFSWEDTRLTAAVLGIFVFSMFAHSLISFLIKGFYALENTRIPLFINIGASAVSIILALVFTKILSTPSAFTNFITVSARVSDIRDPRVLGLALGFSCGTLMNFLLLCWGLKRLAHERFGEYKKFPLTPVLKIIFSALLAGGATYLTRVSFAETQPLISFGAVLAQGAIAGIVGLAVYFGALFLMKEEGVYTLWRVLRRRLLSVGVLPEQWDGDAGKPDI